MNSNSNSPAIYTDPSVPSNTLPAFISLQIANWYTHQNGTPEMINTSKVKYE